MISILILKVRNNKFSKEKKHDAHLFTYKMPKRFLFVSILEFLPMLGCQDDIRLKKNLSLQTSCHDPILVSEQDKE